MQRMGPSSAFVDISAALARGQVNTATGFLKVVPDPHVATMTTLVAKAKANGSQVFRDAVFVVPMGHSMGPQGFSIPLEDLWGRTDTGGIRLEIETTTMSGGMGGDMAPSLVEFILDANLTFRG